VLRTFDDVKSHALPAQWLRRATLACADTEIGEAGFIPA
jgi:hypothetical protein